MSSNWSVETNGITYQRAVELDGELPRIDVATFRFDELTRQEQEDTIRAKERELNEALLIRADTLTRVYRGYAKIREEKANGVHYGGQDNMIKPHLNTMRKEATERVKRLQARIKDLRGRLKA